MRLPPIAFAGLLLLASCSPSEPTVTIRGTVAAADGSTLEDSWITVCDHACRSLTAPLVQTQPAGGSFDLKVPARPTIQVVAAAPGFDREVVRLIAGPPGSHHDITFELGRPEYRETPEFMEVRYWPNGVGNGGWSQPMTQDDSGIWTAAIAPREAETFYLFQGPLLTGGVLDSSRPYAATPAGAIFSVAPASEDSLRFTYMHQVREQVDGRVTLGAESQGSEVWREAEEQFRAHQQSFYASPEDAKTYDWSVAEATRDSFLEATQGVTREAIALSYLGSIPDKREATTRLILDTVRPASAAWDWTDRYAPVNLISGAEDIREVHAYLRQVFDHMSNDSLAAFMMQYAALTLAGEFTPAARAKGNWDAIADSLAMTMYGDLVQAYPNASSTKLAAKTLDPDRAIQNGKRVPDFELVSMDEPDRVISNESLLGTTYLVDFWGTWCPPCIGEMPFMHAAYAKYKDRGFTILSLAWDRRDRVDAFREEWPMPWENVLLEGYGTTGSNPVLDAFNVRAYPDILLVSSEGIILEVEEAHLREAALDSTLAVHLGD